VDLLEATIFIFIYSIAALGWGRMAATVIYKLPTRSLAYDVTLGLAIWIWMGGILNAFRWVNSFTLKAILAAGLLFSVTVLVRFLLSKKRRGKEISVWFQFAASKEALLKKVLDALPILLILAVSVYLAVNLLPASGYNLHDDFYKYLPRLFRLLHTGKVGGTPFDFIGIDSFGALSLLQVFFIEHLTFKFVNSFDAILCFLLGGLLINDLGRRMNLIFFYRCGAIIIYLLIQPHFVNISALYSGSLIIIALIYSYILFQSSLNGETLREGLLAAIPISLFIASLSLLKITFAPFAAASFLTFYVLVLFFNSERQKTAIISFGSALLVVIIIIPWMWGAMANLSSLINKFLIKVSEGAGTQNQSAAGDSFLIKFFAAKDINYGGNLLDFTFMYGLILLAILTAIYMLIKE